MRDHAARHGFSYRHRAGTQPRRGTRTPGGTWAEGGSVLMLVPAAVLVLVILGAIAVDFSMAYLGQRELTSAAAAAANDAATAIATDRFYQGRGDDAAGTVTIDEDRAAVVVSQALAGRAPTGVAISDVSVDPFDDQVCVVLRGRVDYVFARAIPGMADGVAVQGRATATAVTGPTGSPVAHRRAC